VTPNQRALLEGGVSERRKKARISGRGRFGKETRGAVNGQKRNEQLLAGVQTEIKGQAFRNLAKERERGVGGRRSTIDNLPLRHEERKSVNVEFTNSWEKENNRRNGISITLMQWLK